MKTLTTITLLLFSLSLSSFPQGYESVFGKESTTWWIMIYMTIATTYEYNFIEERIINGKTYKYDKGFYLRESDDNSKLYILSIDWTEEMLLMDLDLEKGDTFRIEGQYIKNDITVVDSVYYDDGRKIIELSYYLPCWWENCPENNLELKLKFHEGIGTNLFDIFSGIFLNCIEKDGVKTYMSYLVKEYQWMNTGKDSCSFDAGWGFIQNKDELVVNIYPNPISNKGELIFNNPDCREFILEIYNVSGILYYKSITRENRFIISSDEFIEGIHFYKLYNPGKNVCTGKIVFIRN